MCTQKITATSPIIANDNCQGCVPMQSFEGEAKQLQWWWSSCETQLYPTGTGIPPNACACCTRLRFHVCLPAFRKKWVFLKPGRATLNLRCFFLLCCTGRVHFFWAWMNPSYGQWRIGEEIKGKKLEDTPENAGSRTGVPIFDTVKTFHSRHITRTVHSRSVLQHLSSNIY